MSRVVVKQLHAGHRIQRSGLFLLINTNRKASAIDIELFRSLTTFFLENIEFFLFVRNKSGNAPYSSAKFEDASVQYREEEGPSNQWVHTHTLIQGSTPDGFIQLNLPLARDWWTDKLGYLPLIRVKKASVTGAGLENYMRK